MSEVKFFGDIDRDYKGNINSSYPAWYFDNNIELLEQTIDSLRNRIENHKSHYEDLPYLQATLRADEKRLQLILESKPKLTNKQKDDLFEDYKSLGKSISDSFFSISEMKMGTVSAHSEYRKQKNPYIPINSSLAKCFGLKVFDGLISRDNAIRVWKIIGKLTGEPTNPEILRKDSLTSKSLFPGLLKEHPQTKDLL